MISADPRINKLFELVEEGYSSNLAAKMAGIPQKEFALIRRTPAFRELSNKKSLERSYYQLTSPSCSLEEYIERYQQSKIPMNRPLWRRRYGSKIP